MKIQIILLAFILNIVTGFGQKSKLKEASPFTAVKWINDSPVVKFENQWYDFEKIDTLNKSEILNFCKSRFGYKWKKRFSEDLIEVLKLLNHIPNKEVKLVLKKDGISKEFMGRLTLENRERCAAYNDQIKKLDKKRKPILKIKKTHLLEDLKEFKYILDTKSSYAQLTTFDYSKATHELANTVRQSPQVMNIDAFTNKLSKIMSEIGDRHSSIKNENIKQQDYIGYDLKLPFGVTVFNNKLIAVKAKVINNSFYLKDYPYIKSIHQIPIQDLINVYAYKSKKAPQEAKLSRAAESIQNFGKLLFKNNKTIPNKILVTLTNGLKDKTLTLNLTPNKKGFVSKLRRDNYKSQVEVMTNKNFKDLIKRIDDICYFNIPAMFDLDEENDIADFFKSAIENHLDTKAMIIDIRNNPGGVRDILKLFSSYIVQPENSPWIANVAYLRSDKKLSINDRSMNSRFLYNYKSSQFSTVDRNAIDIFNQDFQLKHEFDNSKFSDPYYMILRSGKTLYKKPVYILVNEKSFSAATVFTTAFKGLPNVKIVGITTDGSSGNSKKKYLKHTQIRVKVSTMLSFQRNGKILDGNGTQPDIYIPITLEQIFTDKDLQLKKLITIINSKS
mgnify:CR=1 FL=1